MELRKWLGGVHAATRAIASTRRAKGRAVEYVLGRLKL